MDLVLVYSADCGKLTFYMLFSYDEVTLFSPLMKLLSVVMVSDFSEGRSEVGVCPAGRPSQSPDSARSPG